MARILVIDDDKNIRFLVREELTLAGHVVESAADGPSGLAAAKEHRPDLIILDIKMPGMSGLEVLPRLKELSPETPVFLFTAFSDYRDEAEALGGDGYFVKSPDFSSLRDAVRDALRRDAEPLP